MTKRRRTSKNTPLPPTKDLKYFLYEGAVQEPKPHIRLLEQIWREVGRKSKALRLREDFCGTFAISRAWVKTDPKRTTLSLDLDPEPLDFGIMEGFKAFPKDAKARITLLRKNVISKTKPLSDLAVAGNFSFFIFKERKTLLEYFKMVRASLTPGGLFVLEMAGGPGLIEKLKEKRICRHPVYGPYEYTWDQKAHDAITSEAQYAIHFKLKSGKRLKNAFEYDWRIWSIPEVRDLLKDAGFSTTYVYWEEGDPRGQGTGEYYRTDKGDNSYSWIAQVVGRK